MAEKKISTVGASKKSPLSSGMDIVTSQDPLWQALLSAFEQYATQYGFTRVELPIVEDPGLYSGLYSVEAVQSRGMILANIGGRELALRSSLLPSMVRILAQMKVGDPQLTKWHYSGSCVVMGARDLVSDYEFGFEVWGTFNHLTEAQVLGSTWQLFYALGLTDVVFEVNTCGSKQSQESYETALRDFLKSKRYELCDSCGDLISEHPRDVLRCSKLDCQAVFSEAPTILDFLDEVSRKQFTNLLEALEELQIPYQLNPLLVGIDGAVGTVVSLKLKVNGAAVVVAEAEGHAGLIQRLGGKQTHAFGLHGSLQVLHKALLERGQTPPMLARRPAEVYLVPLGELAAKRSLRLFRDLVEAGVTVFDYFGYAGVKNQLRAAQEANSPIALIMGQKEALDEVVILRDVKSGMQEVFSYDKILEEVKKRLGR
ncbi:MAG: ATP phosphoribosyltransferase regulatory subunit [Candidatus Doudnabacteria bacterium]|nr:ATP phosphoribosyltransferase regulatory subunit [Candidatus Doudnabacteria bacterium]